MLRGAFTSAAHGFREYARNVDASHTHVNHVRCAVAQLGMRRQAFQLSKFARPDEHAQRDSWVQGV